MNIINPHDAYDCIFGRVYSLPGATLLSIGISPQQLTSILPVASGLVCVRYGMRLLSQPNHVIVPNQFIAENGNKLEGREAWHYMQRCFEHHPFAKVMGWDTNGKTKQLALKEIDFTSPVCVLIYSQTGARVPSVEVNGLLIGERAPDISDLMAQYLPVMDDFERFLKPQLMISAS